MVRTIRSFVPVTAMLLLLPLVAVAAQPPLAIDAPRGGEFYTVGSVQTVQVSARSRYKTVLIELSRDGGTTFAVLGTIDNTAIHDPKLRNMLPWTVAGPVSAACVLRASVADRDGNLIHAVSSRFIIGAVTANDDGSTTVELPTSSVTDNQLADGSVTTAKLADSAVVNAKIAAGAVSAAKITSGAASDGMVLTADGSGGASFAPLPDGASFTGTLAGDVTGTQKATVVVAVGGQSAVAVASGAVAANAATDANNASAIVKRDAGGNFTAATITAGLNGTAANATQLNGQPATFYLDAGNIAAGTLDDARLSANVTRHGNAFNAASQLVQLDASAKLPAADGSQLTSLTAANLVGAVGAGNGGTGLTTPGLAGNVLRSDGTGWTSAPLQIADLPSGVTANPLQIALLRWYPAIQTGQTFAVALQPAGICFDGASVWIVNGGANNVTKMRASDGATLGTYATGGTWPHGICFDGTNIWLANTITNTVTKLRASDGTLLGTYAVGANPWGPCLCFDGTNIWVSSYNNNTVSKLRASDGATLATYAVGAQPDGACFDGANVWVANQGGNNVTKLRASDGAALGTYAVETQPYGVCFDGASIWVANLGSGTVTKLRASDGTTLGTYTVGGQPRGVCFDGASIWVGSSGSGVTKLRASDGALLGTFAGVSNGEHVCFDGANIWAVNYWVASITKF